MKNLKEKIEVMQAALDGAAIDKFNGHKWIAIPFPEHCDWDWLDWDYRIKPEPVEFWVKIYENEDMLIPITKNPELIGRLGAGKHIKTIKVREVTE